MYIFVTYGEPGWRGVQVRALRIAKHFPKDKVLFFNGLDSDFIKKEGFPVETVDLSLTQPEKIKLPKKTRAIIFADLPTNELFNTSLFVAAKERGIPTIVFDNLYRRGQTKEGVYRKYAKSIDLFLLNGLSFMRDEEAENIKIVPPFVPYQPKPDMKEKIIKKYNFKSGSPLIYAIGYHPEVFNQSLKLYQKLAKKTNNFSFILSGEKRQKKKKKKNLLILPYQSGGSFFELIDASDLVICKMGYLQILEVLALKKPVIILGEGGYVLKKGGMLDKHLQEVIWQENKLTPKTASYILSLITSKPKYKMLKNKVEALHDGSLNGDKQAADLIKKLSKKGKKLKFSKRVLVVLNEELKKARKFIQKEDFLLPIVIIASTSKQGPMSVIKRPSEEILKGKVEELLTPHPGEILAHSFSKIYLLDRRKYDGFLDILPWYSHLLKEFVNFLKTADEILITPQALKFVKNLLSKIKQEKIKQVRF